MKNRLCPGLRSLLAFVRTVGSLIVFLANWKSSSFGPAIVFRDRFVLIPPQSVPQKRLVLSGKY